MQLHVRQHNSCKCNICSCQGAYGRGLPEVVPVILPCPFQPCQQMNCAANMRPARLELCKAKTQDVSQRGRTIINVAFLHFLHYFSLLHPIFPAQKSAGAANAAAPNRRLAASSAAGVEPCTVRPAGLPAATNGLSCVSFYCTFCIISTPPSHLPAQKNARASNAGVPNMRIAACLPA